MSATARNVDKARYEGLEFKDQVREGMVPVVNAEAISDSQISTERNEEELHLERDRRLQAEEKQKQVERELQELRDKNNKPSQDASSSNHGPSNKLLIIAGMAVIGLMVMAATVIAVMVTRGNASSNDETSRSMGTNLRSNAPVAISPVAPNIPPVEPITPVPRPTVAPVSPPPPMPRPTPRPVFQPTNNQNVEQNLASRSTISIGYLGDAFGCTLSIGITIGGATWVPIGNPYIATQVPSGVQNYSITGNILCPLAGSCLATGSGTITIWEQELYLVTWGVSAVGVCTVSLVLNEQ